MATVAPSPPLDPAKCVSTCFELKRCKSLTSRGQFSIVRVAAPPIYIIIGLGKLNDQLAERTRSKLEDNTINACEILVRQ
jgi:hypothetical protein